MEKHIIGQRGKKDSNRYSIFKNPNEELRKEISEYDPDIPYFIQGWPNKDWVIDTWETDEVKCVAGKNVMYFPRKDVEEFIINEKERLRNNKYPAYKYFKQCFGVISRLNIGDRGYSSLSKLDLNNGMDIGAPVGIKQEINTMDVCGYDTFIEYSINPYYGLSFEASNHGRMLNIYFTKDGDFINRDYNEAIQDYKCEDISVDELLTQYREKLQEIPVELEFFRGKYYSKDICYVPDFDERKETVHLYYARRKASGMYQVSSGWSNYKKPKGTVKKTREDLIEDLRKLFKEHLKIDL